MISLEDIGNLNTHLNKLKENQVVDVPNLTGEETLALKKFYNDGKYLIRGPIRDENKGDYILGFELNNSYRRRKNA